MELTADQLKKVAESDKFKIFSSNVLLTMAHSKVTTERVNSYAVPLFRSMGFVEGKESLHEAGQAITDPKYGYLAFENSKCPLFDEYEKLLHQKHLDHGYEVKLGYCPALIADNQQREAENQLIQFMEKSIGMPQWILIEDREKMLNLYVGIRATQLSKEGIKC
jgi:hypothetical protein